MDESPTTISRVQIACLGREVEDEKGVVNVVEGKHPVYSKERITNTWERFLRGEIVVDNSSNRNNHTKRD